MEEKTIEIKISKNLILFLLAFVGFILTILLAVVYFNANFNPESGASFCTSQQNPVINCDGVAKSVDSQFLGIPLAYWGMFYYIIVMVLLGVDKLKTLKGFEWMEVFKNPLSYISILGIFSFIVSIIMAYISVINLKMVCVLCAITYLINFFIAVFATGLANETFGTSLKNSINDFMSALKESKYNRHFILAMVIGVVFLVITTTTNVFTPQLKDLKVMDQIRDAQTNLWADASQGNVLGDENAKLQIRMYSDLMCPYCVMENRLLHKLMKDLKGVRVEFVQYPLDNACNKNIPSEFHKGACEFAKIALAAKKQNKFWEMVNLIFENRVSTPEEVFALAEQEGIYDVAKLKADSKSAEVKNQLLKDIDEATEMKVGGTPAFSFKGQLFMGLKPYSEVKGILMSEGAKKRK